MSNLNPAQRKQYSDLYLRLLSSKESDPSVNATMVALTQALKPPAKATKQDLKTLSSFFENVDFTKKMKVIEGLGTPFAKNFSQSILDQNTRGKKLTSKQTALIDKLYEEATNPKAPVVDQAMIDRIDKAISKSPKVSSFLNSLKSQVLAGRKLSPKQEEALQNIEQRQTPQAPKQPSSQDDDKRRREILSPKNLLQMMDGVAQDEDYLISQRALVNGFGSLPRHEQNQLRQWLINTMGYNPAFNHLRHSQKEKEIRRLFP